MRLSSARLLDGTSLDLGRLNVLVGGNSTGKSTFLYELYVRATGFQNPKWYWINEYGVRIDHATTAEDMRRLLLSATSFIYEGEQVFVPTSAKNFGGDVDQDRTLHITVREYESIRDRIQKQPPADLSDLLTNSKYVRPFVSFMNCETRLGLNGTAQLMDYGRPPGDALNVLYRNRELSQSIDRALESQFGYRLTCLNHHGISIVFGLSKEPAPLFDPAAADLSREFERIEQWKVGNLTEFNECGHGIRSVLKLLISFYDPINDILLIDEPELHVYPAQKRWLGRQLAQLAAERKKQVFLVTHDPVILQGVLDSLGNTHVIRFEMDAAGKRTIKQFEINNAEHIGAKKNQDSYLQALFYQRSIGVEGATDRAFYQNMVESLLGSIIAEKDLGFIACGGVGPSKNMAEISVRMGLKMAFIYDFDALFLKLPTLRQIYEMRGGKETGLRELHQLLKEKFGADEKVMKQGTDDASKRGLQSAFVQASVGLFEKCLEQLSGVGIFIVPGGSLESWAPAVESKTRFAESAADLILRSSDLKGPLSRFLGKVVAYFT